MIGAEILFGVRAGQYDFEENEVPDYFVHIHPLHKPLLILSHLNTKELETYVTNCEIS